MNLYAHVAERKVDVEPKRVDDKRRYGHECRENQHYRQRVLMLEHPIQNQICQPFESCSERQHHQKKPDSLLKSARHDIPGQWDQFNHHPCPGIRTTSDTAGRLGQAALGKLCLSGDIWSWTARAMSARIPARAVATPVRIQVSARSYCQATTSSSLESASRMHPALPWRHPWEPSCRPSRPPGWVE